MLQGMENIMGFQNQYYLFLRIQRAWRHYAANRPTHQTHHSDSFEEQVYQATGLNVTEIITGNYTPKNTTPDQPETTPTDHHEKPSTLHDSVTHNQACSSEAVVEGTEEINGSPTAQVVQDITESNPTVDDSNESNLIVQDIGKSSPANTDTTEETHQEDAVADGAIQKEESTSSVDMQEKDSRVDDKISEAQTKVSDQVVTQKGDKKVRFNLQDSEDKEDLTVTQNTVTSDDELTLSDEEKKSDFLPGEISFTMPAEKVKQLGYTQLRELKCSLETKLGCELLNVHIHIYHVIHTCLSSYSCMHC